MFERIPPEQWLAADALAFAVADAHPVSPGHCLIVPRRRIATWFEATADELTSKLDLVRVVKGLVDRERRPDGYNAGAAAGQTVPHAHLHVIPRWAGDVEDPTGGVRHAVVGRGRY
ncbi:HIT family protein [Frigoribacterium salinisoli]